MKARAIVAAMASALAPVVAAAGGTLLLAGCTSCQSTVRTFSVPAIAGASFDGAAIDQTSHRVYLADQTASSIAAVDVSGTTPRLAGTVKLDQSPSGIALAPDRHLLYAGVGTAGVAVVDTETMKLVKTIAAGGLSVDLLDYSAKTSTLYLGAESSVVMVDATSGTPGKRITTAAAVEQPRFDQADGMVYATVPETSSLVQMDPQTGYVTHTYVIPKCRPKGLAINPSRQLAVAACGSSIALVNLQSGAQQISRSVQGGDVVSYDPSADRFVVASPHGARDSSIGVFAGDGRFIGSVSATPTAHAGVYDAAHGVAYAPAPAGLMSFAAAQCEPPPDWLKFTGGLSLFAIPLVAFGIFLALYARRLKRGPRGPSGPSDRDLHEEDLVLERERIKALEDAIYGPEA